MSVKVSTADAPNSFLAVELEVANMSQTIKNMLEDFGTATDITVPLHNVTRPILERVVAFCTHKVNNPVAAAAAPAPAPAAAGTPTTVVLSDYERDFCTVDQDTLFQLILAANYLDIKPLLDVTCQAVANMIKGKTPEEIRQTFNIKNDFTPEEEEKIRKENEWCEDK